MTKKLLQEGGAGGHMFHPFNLPSVNTGRDLIDFFYKAADFVSRNPEAVVPSDSTSLKVDGANTSFKLVKTSSGLEFALDRGSMFPIDIEGITIDRLTERWSPGHGMVAMGKILLSTLNRALPKIKPELIALGMLDKKGNANPTIFINAEFCWKETNAVKYEEDFIALHSVNQFYEKDYRGNHRPGAVRPMERDEKSGKMKPTKAKGTEIPYDEQVMESLKRKILPFFRQVKGPDNPEGFNVYTVIPVTIKQDSDLVSAINEKLNEELSIQIKEPALNEWNANSSGVATMSIKDWLSDERTVNPRGTFIKTSDGSKKGAMSKEIYGRVLSGEPVESIVADPESWDVPMAINGALFYYAIENVGATILEALTSPLGDMVTDEMAHEGIVLRNQELFGVKMVKITGNFITQGASGKFAGDRGTSAEQEQVPEQGDPLESPEQPSEGLNEEVDSVRPFRIALVPGAFKPPHRGHLNMVERFSKINGIDKVIVLISRPLKSARTLPSGEIITAEHSKLIWEQFLVGSGIEKAEVHISTAASPVQVVYDYVMRDPDPNNDLVAPEGAEVYMGCGDKGDDSSRFDDIARKSRQDINLKIVTCQLDQRHSEEYMSLLESVPEVKNNLPSVKKGLDPKDFHASDMRLIADMSSRQMIGFELFKDFVPEGDALAVLGVLGINPVNGEQQQDLPPDENLEEKPDENLMEIMFRYIEEAISESYQDGVAKPRMRDAMAFYLDQGRKDLVKYGAPWNQPRPKTSNAFLAKESINLKIKNKKIKKEGGFAGPIIKEPIDVDNEWSDNALEEISTMSGGAIAFAPSKSFKLPVRRKRKKAKRKKTKQKTKN